jgi:WD repeat and SOF domain-containing protein 1
MRKLDAALVVHKDHVSAVMDVSWSPTGREFATASYDKTVRIWNASGGASKQVYHTKRMQRVWTVDFTRDAKYIVSGSDDTNLRVWKADASAVEGIQAPRARAKVNYNKSLLKRYAHMPEVKRIVKQQYTPKFVSKAGKRARQEESKEASALANVNRHSKTPTRRTAEKKRSIVSQHE